MLTCIREHLTIDTAGRRLAVNAERYLKPPAEMARLFRDAPEAIAETIALDRALTFSLDELKYEYPDETVAGFATPQEALEHLTWEGARERYPDGIHDKVRKSLANELALIASCNYAPYFLTVYDIVRFARSQDILCQGRGSAANSTVCYCLGITSVDPVRGDLLFERFISTERHEPPDIDVDFEHERREEVIQYIYGKYGRDRAGIAGDGDLLPRPLAPSAKSARPSACPRTRSARCRPRSGAWAADRCARAELKRAGIDMHQPAHDQDARARPTRSSRSRAISPSMSAASSSPAAGSTRWCRSMNGAMEDRTIVEWDKDDLDALGILKVDVLGLGMLTCMRKAFELAESITSRRSCSTASRLRRLATVPAEEKAVYRMLCRADSLGVFQVESRAQMSMLPRLRPENSTTSSSRSRSCGRARSRATWCTLICAAGRASKTSLLSVEGRSKPCSARRSACRCSRSRR